MTEDQVRDMLEKVAAAARRAKSAEIDAAACQTARDHTIARSARVEYEHVINEVTQKLFRAIRG